MYECHGHIIADGIDYRAAQARHQTGVDTQYVKKVLETLRGAGIEFYRDGGDSLGVSEYAKRIAAEYGVDYRTPLYIVHHAARYGALYGKAYIDMTACAALISNAYSNGADFIKTAASGMMDFENGGLIGEGTPFGELEFIVNTARKTGLCVMTHANGAENIKNALKSGTASIEHGFLADRDSISMMRDYDVVWVPTCVTVANNTDGARYPSDTMKRIIDAHSEMLVFARDTGVLIACGSDCGAFGVLQGAGTREEHAFLSALGIDTKKADKRIREVFKARL